MQKPLDVLRDRTAGTAVFRGVAKVICARLMRKTRFRLQESKVNEQDIVIVIILRAAISFLDAATEAFSDAPVGILGLKRDERTFKPHWYYENLPPLSNKSTVVILDPMLATGGSSEAAIDRLVERGAALKNIYFVGIIAAPEGLARLAELIPKEHIVLATVDERLDEFGMIVPGVGDFGDRYFGYGGRATLGS